MKQTTEDRETEKLSSAFLESVLSMGVAEIGSKKKRESPAQGESSEKDLLTSEKACLLRNWNQGTINVQVSGGKKVGYVRKTLGGKPCPLRRVVARPAERRRVVFGKRTNRGKKVRKKTTKTESARRIWPVRAEWTQRSATKAKKMQHR